MISSKARSQQMHDIFEKVAARYRELTFKRMKGCLTDSEQAWLDKATKAFYGKFGRSPDGCSDYKLKKLAEAI